MAGEQKWPEVREISLSSLMEVIRAGVADFRAAPGYGATFGALYAAAGWLLIGLVWYFDMPYFAYPLAMGFALIAPLAAAGFYAISDLIERGERLTWEKVLGALRLALGRDLRWMALVTGFALFLWLDFAAILTFSFGGLDVLSLEFLNTLLTTSSGLTFLLAGNVIGAVIAMAVFSISVVSFPMLYDRDIDFVTAMVTSVRLVKANPVTMAVWCAIIAVSVVVSIATGFFGLIVLLPIIGHATWHLYRRAVEPQAA